MAYATREDIVALHSTRFLENLADRDENDELDTESINKALELASSEVDSYLSVRYATPITTATAMMQTATIEIAAYRLANSGTGLTDDIRKRYEDMIAWLKSVAAGKANLGIPALDNEAEEPVSENFIVPKGLFGTTVR